MRRLTFLALVSASIACGSGKKNASCTTSADCAANLICQGNGTAKECVPPGLCASTQQSCNSANQCGSSQDCVNNCCTDVSGCFRDGDCSAATPHCDVVSHVCK